jgi:hypothetical protein
VHHCTLVDFEDAVRQARAERPRARGAARRQPGRRAAQPAGQPRDLPRLRLPSLAACAFGLSIQIPWIPRAWSLYARSACGSCSASCRDRGSPAPPALCRCPVACGATSAINAYLGSYSRVRGRVDIFNAKRVGPVRSHAGLNATGRTARVRVAAFDEKVGHANVLLCIGVGAALPLAGITFDSVIRRGAVEAWERQPATSMTSAIVRLGTPRQNGEGLRIGTVRRPRARRAEGGSSPPATGTNDVWLPERSPSEATVRRGAEGRHTRPRTGKRCSRKRYKRNGDGRPALGERACSTCSLLSRAKQNGISPVGLLLRGRGPRCHRSILRRLLWDAAARC